MTPLLAVRDLVQEFDVPDGRVHALSGVSLDVAAGETVGVVGETGSGKSTLARSILQIPPPRAGSVTVEGTELVGLRGRALHAARRRVQMVFQDPFGSLDPRWRVADLVAEPRGRGMHAAARAHELLELVGLDPSTYADRRPRELSGGQAQRVAIARSLAPEPALVLCDEAVSALDVLVQAQVLNLIEQVRRELGVAFLFISHDLALIRQTCDRVAVLHLGQLAEVGPAATITTAPRHPYTAALLASVPTVRRERRTRRDRRERVPVPLDGDPPSPMDPPSGCRFRTRCPRAQERCALVTPVPHEIEGGHQVACHFPLTPDPRSAP